MTKLLAEFLLNIITWERFDSSWSMFSNIISPVLMDSDTSVDMAFCIRWPENMQFKGCFSDRYTIKVLFYCIFFQNNPKNLDLSILGLFRKGKPHNIVKFHRIDSVICIYSTMGVQILMQLGRYLAFNHDLHEIGTCIV